MCYNSLIESSVLLIPKTDIYIPAGSLTQEGEYCLTEEAVQQMMDVACAGVSREDPVVQ